MSLRNVEARVSMLRAPVTQYARSGGVSIAYQVIGDGEFDVVYIPGAISHVDLIWDDPAKARFFEKLAASCRLIVVEKRGTGASDPVEVADLETRIDDVRAHLFAATDQHSDVDSQSRSGTQPA